ncbi:sigma-E processing peptidase SpoIIGA [Rummeliibacillus pycnus]|uniref:sigma-E processing peptidase SpoIIGA n=1 Tax=Rummeliibacillus pycnus TaxID=101070 RepID=UPI003D265159
MYGEVLILINALFNYVILSFTNSICYMQQKRIRLIVSAFVAGIWIVIFGHQFLMMVIAFILMISIAFGIQIRRWWKAALMCFVAALFAGGLFTAFEPLWMHTSVFTLIIISGVVATAGLFLLKSRMLVARGDTLQQRLVQLCELQIGEISISLKCFIDTGNTTVEPLSGKSVHFVRYKAIEHSLPENLKMALFQWDVNEPYDLDMFPEEYLKRVAVIPITTVQEKKTYSLALRYDKWLIMDEETRPISPGFFIITIQNTPFPQEADAILHFTALYHI